VAPSVRTAQREPIARGLCAHLDRRLDREVLHHRAGVDGRREVDLDAGLVFTRLTAHLADHQYVARTEREGLGEVGAERDISLGGCEVGGDREAQLALGVALLDGIAAPADHRRPVSRLERDGDLLRVGRIGVEQRDARCELTGLDRIVEAKLAAQPDAMVGVGLGLFVGDDALHLERVGLGLEAAFADERHPLRHQQARQQLDRVAGGGRQAVGRREAEHVGGLPPPDAARMRREAHGRLAEHIAHQGVAERAVEDEIEMGATLAVERDIDQLHRIAIGDRLDLGRRAIGRRASPLREPEDREEQHPHRQYDECEILPVVHNHPLRPVRY
jgi:hypothetical protein